MKYEEIVEKVKKSYAKADASLVKEHLAVQVNVSGEGEGAFYIEIANGAINVEPYEYYDRDFIISCEAAVILDIAAGKKKLIPALESGEAFIAGNWDKASIFDLVAVKKAEKAPAKKAPAKKSDDAAKATKKAEAEAAKAAKKAEADAAKKAAAEAKKAEAEAAKAAKKAEADAAKAAKKAEADAAKAAKKAEADAAKAAKKAEDKKVAETAKKLAAAGKKTEAKKAPAKKSAK